MQRTTLKFRSSGLFLFAVATFFLATFLPTNNAHAGRALSGTITLDVQYVCHDGGNRGYATRIWLSKQSLPNLNLDGSPRHSFWKSIYKHYYDSTECMDLSTKVNRGDFVYVYYARDGGYRQCPHFRLRYVPNRTDIWIQNLGSTAYNVSCVAKWSLKSNVNSPQIRRLTVFEASEICHDGANRGAEARLQVSDGNNRWVPAGMTFKGYYTKTQCFKFPGLKDGTKVSVYHQRQVLEAGADAGHIEWCADFVVKINKKAKPMWVQTTGHTVFDMRCRARRNI